MTKPQPTPASVPNYDRWTPPKMVAFLHELSATRSVKAAARAVGMSRNSAYRLRARSRGQAFALAWDAALESAWIRFRTHRADGDA